MGKSLGQVISEDLRENEAFLNDLRVFAKTEVDVLVAVLEHNKEYMHRILIPEESIRAIADRYDLDYRDLRKATRVMGYVRSTAMEKSASPTEVVEEIRNVLSDVSLTGDEQRYMELFQYTDKEEEAAKAWVAFSIGSTYLDSNICPAFLPASGAESRLVGGFIWSLTYLDSQRETRTAMFALAPSELDEVERRIKEARRQLQGIQSNLREDKKVTDANSE